MCTPDIFLGILAILFPPIAVWVKRGVCSADSIINIALCCLGFVRLPCPPPPPSPVQLTPAQLPGLIHAWYIIGKYPEDPIIYSRVRDEEENPRPVRQQPQQERLVYTLAAPQGEAGGYGSFNAGVGGSAEGGGREGGEGVDGPPSYASVVKGDNKVQH